MKPTIDVTDVSFAYRLARNRASSLHEVAVRWPRPSRQSRELLWALDTVNMHAMPGEIIGIVGDNGAGKSTLMKVIARVLPPARGRVVVRGRVAPLIELSGGFHSDLDGRENLLIAGTILGHDPRVLRANLTEIAAWAGLTHFMDVPVRAYSSGMLARLGFAVATFGDPRVLLVDETFAVGDQDFQRLCKERILRLVERGSTVVLVSHELALITEMASRAIWLDRGRVVSTGPSAEVVASYQQAETHGPIPRSDASDGDG